MPENILNLSEHLNYTPPTKFGITLIWSKRIIKDNTTKYYYNIIHHALLEAIKMLIHHEKSMA